MYAQRLHRNFSILKFIYFNIWILCMNFIITCNALQTFSLVHFRALKNKPPSPWNGSNSNSKVSSSYEHWSNSTQSGCHSSLSWLPICVAYGAPIRCLTNRGVWTPTTTSTGERLSYLRNVCWRMSLISRVKLRCCSSYWKSILFAPSPPFISWRTFYKTYARYYFFSFEYLQCLLMGTKLTMSMILIPQTLSLLISIHRHFKTFCTSDGR